jgi:hypothetical protein
MAEAETKPGQGIDSMGRDHGHALFPVGNSRGEFRSIDRHYSETAAGKQPLACGGMMSPNKKKIVINI